MSMRSRTALRAPVKRLLCRVLGHRIPEARRFLPIQRRARCERCGKRVRIGR